MFESNTADTALARGPEAETALFDSGGSDPRPLRLKSLAGLTSVLGGLYVSVATLAVSVAIAWTTLLVMAMGGDEGGAERWLRVLSVLGLMQLAAAMVTGVVFLVWFRRAYHNVWALGAHDLRYSRGWAIGAWFVPFANLVLPMRLAEDMWRASYRRANPFDKEGGDDVSVVRQWWARVLTAAFLPPVAVLVVASGAAAESAGEVRFGLVLMVIAAMVSAAAAMAARRLVTEVAYNQSERR